MFVDHSVLVDHSSPMTVFTVGVQAWVNYFVSLPRGYSSPFRAIAVNRRATDESARISGKSRSKWAMEFVCGFT